MSGCDVLFRRNRVQNGCLAYRLFTVHFLRSFSCLILCIQPQRHFSIGSSNSQLAALSPDLYSGAVVHLSTILCPGHFPLAKARSWLQARRSQGDSTRCLVIHGQMAEDARVVVVVRQELEWELFLAHKSVGGASCCQLDLPCCSIEEGNSIGRRRAVLSACTISSRKLFISISIICKSKLN